MNIKKMISVAAAAAIAMSVSIPAFAKTINVTWSNGSTVTTGSNSTGTLSEVITDDAKISVKMKMLGSSDADSSFVLKNGITDVLTISKAGWTSVPYMVKGNIDGEAQAVLSYDSDHKEPTSGDHGSTVYEREFTIELDFDETNGNTYTVTAETLDKDTTTTTNPVVTGNFDADSIDSLYIKASGNSSDTVSISTITIEMGDTEEPAQATVTYDDSKQFTEEEGFTGSATAVTFMVTSGNTTETINVEYNDVTKKLNTNITGGEALCGIIVEGLVAVNAGNFSDTFNITIE